MNEWTGHGDQYIVDTDSRYPDYSDTFYNRPNKMMAVRNVKNFEDKYQYEQQYIPAQCGHRCRTCSPSDLYPQPRPPMRTQSVNERENRRLGYNGPWPAPMPAAGAETTPPAPATGAAPALKHLHLDSTASILLMFFVFIVFICCCCVNYVGSLHAHIKSLKKQARNQKV